ncbi:MAG TPA: PVC-type heme-binding CxxCH protein [Pirellulaceae bacterium]|jgi:putative heme-binding domain-containing protein
MAKKSIRSTLLFSCLVIILFARQLAAADPAWREVTATDDWKKAPSGEKNRLWYRCKIAIPSAWQGRELKLVVESIDDAREIYLNGVLVGRLGEFPPNYKSALSETHRFNIPEGAAKFGVDNALTIRVCNIEGRTGFNVAAPVLFAGDQAIRLAGKWETTNGDDLAWAKSDPAQIKTAAFDKLEDAQTVERELKKLSNDDGPLSPEQSLARMKTPDDLAVDLVLSEPHISQPLSMKFDSRGRLWVVNYLQYPMPAGLKMISQDKFLRSVYDQVTPPPPNHFRGADKITIHEDTDGDGKYDQHKTFLEGLSLCTSFEFGRGGVWVLQPPYLLFYPDANRDDIPDGDPVVHLEGFNFEDSHSVTNNLRWGPDGWLYSSQGSTVTANVKRPGDKTAIHSEGQLIWRYHPELKKYEIFAEGGGNAFGIEFDDKGRIYSGHNGGNTRGFHYVQGGYYQKSFGKHGDLSNPFSFGYFEAMASAPSQRFTHTFIIYDGGALPDKYNGRLFGVHPLGSHVVLSNILPDRSSFKTVDTGHALDSTDTWFRPVDIQLGPDGALYVADFYEQRIDHASHYQGRVHKESGRIYRLSSKNTLTRSASEGKLFDLSKEDPKQLQSRLLDHNKWFRQAALRELINKDSEVPSYKPFGKVARLLPFLKDGQRGLEQLWGLNALLPKRLELEAFDHTDPYVRVWSIRLVCDDGETTDELAAKLADLAYREPNVEVRSQLACSARRLPAAQAMPIIKNLAQRSQDVDDIHIPLLLWWAIESKADADRDAVLALFTDKAFWDQPIVSKHLSERLMRRYAATGQRKDLLTAAKLLELAPTKEHASRLMAGLEAAYEGRTIANLPVELATAMSKAGASSPTIRLRQGEPAAVAEALKTIADDKADAAKRQQLVAIFATINQPSCVPALLKIVADSRNDGLKSAALGALQSYGDPSIGSTVIDLYNNLPDQVRDVAQSLIASRKNWSEQFLAQIDAQKIDAKTVSEPTVRRFLLHDSSQIAMLCKKHFGDLSGPSPEELRAQIEKLIGVIGQAKGNPYSGRKLYVETCGKCHTLFNKGGKIGPDLTTYKRDDLRGMLMNVVNPSAEIREGFENFVARTTDGRTLTGLIADQDPSLVVLRGADGQNISLPRESIEDLRAIKTSLMPDGQLKLLTDQQIRDLFAYLRSTQPLAERN